MEFAFATCERKLALTFLKKLYPSKNIIDANDSAGDLLDLVERDEIRITDPDFHGGQILRGKNWNGETEANFISAMVKMGIGFFKN